MSLKSYSLQDLENEIQRRNAAQNKPEPLEFADFTQLIQLVKDYVNTENLDEDQQHYIFEAAVEAVYGKDIWSYLNSR